MAEIIQQPDVALPENLKRQFTSLERRLWKVETAVAVSSALIGLAASYLILFFSDRLWDTPAWFRLLVFCVGTVGAVFALGRWLMLWILNRRDWRALSILVQKKFRRLGDRLLGIVELATQTDRPPDFSPELCRAAIRQVAEEAEKYDFRAVVDKSAAKKLMAAGICLLVIVLVPVIVVPATSWNVFRRWLAPMAAIERLTLVRIAGLPEKLVVPHGENFEVVADVDYGSFWRPSHAIAQFERQPDVESKVQQRKVRFQVPGQIEKGTLKIRIGDARRELAIQPAYRPALKQLSAKIELPDYLKYPPVEEKIQSGTLTLLESSHVSFKGKVSRNLKNAWLSDGKTNIALTISGDEFSTLPLVSDGVSHFTFGWQDDLGLSNAAPWRLAVQPQRDQPPVPDLPELSREVAMLHSDVLSIKTVAKDDFGVREVGLSWDYLSGTEESASWGTTEVKMGKNSPREKHAEEKFQWSPIIFRIPPDTSVELLAFATDYFPGRERVESLPHHIQILSNEQHAELVRQNLESVLARVEEVARLQEKVLARTGELKEDQKLSPKEAAEKIGKTGDEQQQSSKNLEELSKEGMNALHEALKNPVFTEQMLQDWSKTMKQMQQLAQGKMKEAAGNLKAAQQQAGDAESKQKELSQAQQKMEEIMQELEELQGKVNKNLDDLQALTLAERLRKVAGTESGAGDELKKIVPETIGMLSTELPDRFRKINTKLARIQEETQKEAQKLQGEINRFYERTQKPNYGEVSKAMTEAHTSEALDELRGLIGENVAMEATRSLSDWSKRFSDWADKLEPPQSDSSNGGGQGASAGVNMTKVLIALLRLRENEMNLQSQTQILDEQKSSMKNFEERAQSLAATQQKLSGILKSLEEQNNVPSLGDAYQETGKAMAEAEAQLKIPETGKPTIAAESKSVDSLTDLINLINEQAQRNPPPPTSNGGEASPEEMAFLMQMMAQQPGQGQGMNTNPQGGGNQRGGNTSRDSKPLTGDANGKGGEERNVNKASGAAAISLPTEFREQLEDYFKALEKEAN